jgi:subtilisin family serine protease
MVANASPEVNALRAEHSCAVQVPWDDEAALAPRRRGQSAAPLDPRQDPREVEEWGEVPEVAPARVSVFVQLADDLEGVELPEVLQDREPSPEGEPAPELPARKLARKGTLVTVELPASDALALGADDAVLNVELGQPLAPPTPEVSPDEVSAPSPELRAVPLPVEEPGPVLIGIVDVGGFDFAHRDFLDENGKTRWDSIWDQGGNLHDSPQPFDYGSVIAKEDLDRAIELSGDAGLPPHELEPQSQMEVGSHGTHVASIAAGNLGIARHATIAGVLVSIPADESARRFSFYDSTRVAHAVEWLLARGRELDMPVSINISLGTNGHAHDDSSAVSRWIDAALTVPGRSVCVAAGNAGQEKAEFEGDMGFILGRVHSGGKIPARQLVADLEWTVVGNGIADLSENELEVWYSAQDRFAVKVKPPDGDWTEEIEPGEFIENRELPDKTFLSIYNELYTASNGLNYIAIYLSPQLRQPQVVGVPAGQWLVRLIGRDVRNGSFDAWIERDDPRRVGRIGQRAAWVFPSFFSEASVVDESTVSSLACGQRVVSVANLDEERRRINPTSSQGPTRDKRQKPDIAAPGTDIVAAKAFAEDGEWVKMTGTSMASPFVAGVAGLMLSVNPGLTGAQIGGILQRTAEPLPGVDFTWDKTWGFGLLAREQCVEEAHTMSTRVNKT